MLVRCCQPETVRIRNCPARIKLVYAEQHIWLNDLKHTFGRGLRAAGVSFEDRQDLLGHRSGRITTHYSQAELASLIAAAVQVCGTESRNFPATTWLRRRASERNVAK